MYVYQGIISILRNFIFSLNARRNYKSIPQTMTIYGLNKFINHSKRIVLIRLISNLCLCPWRTIMEEESHFQSLSEVSELLLLD